MQLKFIIDEKYDKEYAEDFGLPRDVLAWVDNFYKTCLPYLELTRDLYQKSWDKINDRFSSYIERTTGYNWFYPEYECVVSTILPGVSNWGNAPKIIRIWEENPYSMRRSTAEELIISHYFEIYKRNYEKEGLTNGQVWALAEIAAFALTSLTPEAKEFWPWDTEYGTDHKYTHIVELQNELKAVFLRRKGFDEYIQKGINLARKFPKMNP